MAIASPGTAAERGVTHDARVLVVDDEADIANLLGTVLREEGFSVRVVTDSRQALDVFNGFKPDLVSLDVMMPSVDGISLCLQLRKESDVPILFVSAKSDPPDRVVGLRIGADDYMGKPFDNNELVARIEALLRRRSYAGTAERDRRQLRFGVFVVDLGSVQAVHRETALPLTPTEFKLLKTLAGEPGRVFTRDDLLTGVWGYEPGSDTRLVDVHVGRLRKKLLDGGVTEVAIETARGFGYKLTQASERQPTEGAAA
jgi:two-component system, OmpR family, response regulator MtrA